MWIDFEEGTRDIHIACPILELAKNEAPKLDDLVIHRANYTPADGAENVKEVNDDGSRRPVRFLPVPL